MRHSGTQRIRRFGATLGFAAIIAGIGAPSAFAQLGLPETNAPVTSTTNALTGTVQQTVDSAAAAVPVPAVSETVTPVVETASQTTAPVVESATKTADEVTKTATQTVAPVVEQVEETVTTTVPAPGSSSPSWAVSSRRPVPRSRTPARRDRPRGQTARRGALARRQHFGVRLLRARAKSSSLHHSRERVALYRAAVAERGVRHRRRDAAPPGGAVGPQGFFDQVTGDACGHPSTFERAGR